MLKYIIKSPKFPLGIIHSLGGSGGTLLSQCLNSMKNVYLLSECNPLSAHLFDYKLNPYVQLKDWYPELYKVVKNKFEKTQLTDPKVFCHFFKLLSQYLYKKKQHLIIRDYNYVDYIGLPFISSPPMYSNLRLALKESFILRQVVLIRHPLMQYNSLRSHTITKDVLHPNSFIEGYLQFLNDFSNSYWVKYEDIVVDPSHYIANICEILQIPFSKNFIHEFHQQLSVTGNFNRIHEKKIVLSNRQILEDPWSEKLKNHPKFTVLISQLGY